MRSYQINVAVYSPLTLRLASGPDDREAMFRYLNDLLGEVSIDVGAFARERLEQLRQTAAEAGYILDIPALTEPMELTHGFTDVTVTSGSGGVGAARTPNQALQQTAGARRLSKGHSSSSPRRC